MTDHSRLIRIRFLLGIVIASLLIAGCSREEPAVTPSLPEGAKVKKEKMRLVGYGIGRNNADGKDTAMDNAMRTLAQQASGVVFRYEKESGNAKLKMQTTAHVSKYKIEKEVEAGDRLVIVMSGDVAVEIVENAKLVETKKVLTCKPEELSEKVQLTIADAAAEAVKQEYPAAEFKEGWVYLTNMLLDVSEDKSQVTATMYFQVLLGAS